MQNSSSRSLYVEADSSVQICLRWSDYNRSNGGKKEGIQIKKSDIEDGFQMQLRLVK